VLCISTIEPLTDPNAWASGNIKLSEIPLVLIKQYTTYELRGVSSFTGRNLSEVGHYEAVCKGSNGTWKFYGDLATKGEPIKNGTMVNYETLLYNIQ